MMTIFHNAVLQALYSSVTERACTQTFIPLQPAGSVGQKIVSGNRYLYWRTTLPSGKRTEIFLGRAETRETIATLEEKQRDVVEIRTLASDVQILRKANFAATDNSTACTLATLFNASVFHNDAVLVGHHAFDAIINSLGVQLPPRKQVRTIDFLSANLIELAIPMNRRILKILRESGVSFRTASEPTQQQSSPSFKTRGQFVDVCLVARGAEPHTLIPVPVLDTYATGLPHFKYLVTDPWPGFVLSKNNAIPVLLPQPARFALHKLITSTTQSSSRTHQTVVDRTQAVMLLDAIMERFPDWLATASHDLKGSARRRVAMAVDLTLQLPLKISERTRDYLVDFRS